MNRQTATIGLLLVLCFSARTVSAAQQSDHGLAGTDKKSELSVLYVGPNPDGEIKVPSFIPENEAERFVELKKERMGAFSTLLEQHFETVKAVNVEDFKPAMSEQFDVTVFDEVPPGSNGQSDGRSMKLPDFDRPAVMIGQVAPDTLDGLQLDWM